MNQEPQNNFQEEIQDLDTRIRALELDIWIGAEPTFTDRFSENSEWLSAALGGDKEQRAEWLARRYCARFPHAALLRTLGRQYPHENLPRWNLGIYARRDAEPTWRGPPDPLLATEPHAVPPTPDTLANWTAELIQAVGQWHWGCTLHDPGVAAPRRLLIRLDPDLPEPNEKQRRSMLRPSVHAGAIPDEGLSDALADQGYYLIEIGLSPERIPYTELPQVPEPFEYLALLECLGEAANTAGLSSMLLRGYPPPVDRAVYWTSFTPDPAVIEVNLAPAADLRDFHALVQPLYAAAQAQSLSPLRLNYNGREQDSGGGGQITVGGATPADSPFFRQPLLLPRLIRYLNRHPGLSYWFATDYVGSGSQAPRPDEVSRERFLELDLALERLETRAKASPESIWTSLAHFLADAGGNSHRSELNIEKLWNPYLGPRGRLGLVELRPFRMAADAPTLTALAALVRALVARLMRHPFPPPLEDWGDTLHERFALPFYLSRDLAEVLEDLADHGLGLGPLMRDRLLDDASWILGSRQWQDARVELRRAHEFWPLIGDVTSQQPSDSRLVDASTARLEVRVTGVSQAEDWQLRVEGIAVPMRVETGGSGISLVMGVRYRAFQPWQGLHPGMPARDSVTLVLEHGPSGRALRLSLHEWIPNGGAYPGLPQGRDDAAARRRQRILSDELGAAELPPALEPPEKSLSGYCLDLRRLPDPG